MTVKAFAVLGNPLMHLREGVDRGAGHAEIVAIGTAG
jgi:hypothetical protein